MSDIKGEDEAEMFEEEVRVDRAVTKEEDESGEMLVDMRRRWEFFK